MTSRIRVRTGVAGKLPPEARIRHRADFTRIQRNGLRAHSKGLTIVANETDASGARLGCAISRRVGGAVVRNRLRRLLREVFRRTRDQLPRVDFVVIAKNDAALVLEGRYERVEEQLLLGIERAVSLLEERARRRAQNPRGPGNAGSRGNERS